LSTSAMVREFRAARQQLVYSAKRTSQLRAAAICIVGGLIGLIPLKAMSRWLDGGPMPEPRAFLLLLCVLLFPLGLLLVVNAIRGLPRLTIDLQGVTLQHAHATKWAHWDSLDPFVVKTTYVGRSRREVKTAAAKITGANGNSSRWRGNRISFTNCFDKPIEEIVTELNAFRASSLGLSETVVSPAMTPEPVPVGLPGFRLPWLTFALLAVLIGAFAVEIKFPVDVSANHDPGLQTLIAWGGLSHNAILSRGEWYRLFTAPLLHGGFAHIAGNGVALLLGGWMLERLVGRLWFFAFFAVSALGGSLVSLVVGPANLVSVGASGALMGMLPAYSSAAFDWRPRTCPARGCRSIRFVSWCPRCCRRSRHRPARISITAPMRAARWPAPHLPLRCAGLGRRARSSRNGAAPPRSSPWPGWSCSREAPVSPSITTRTTMSGLFPRTSCRGRRSNTATAPRP
jgi:membrane associated rhomboid family serine protease